MGTDNDQLLGMDFKITAKASEDYLTDLVGEGKKFGGNADLAKGHAHLQSHAKTLEDENALLRGRMEEMAKSSSTTEDVLAMLKKAKTPEQIAADQLAAHQDEAQPLTAESVAKLISGALDQRDDERKADNEADVIKANQKVFWGTLSEKYGDVDKAKAAVTMYMGTDASKRNLVKMLGSSDPAALVELITVTVKPQGEQMDFGTGDAGKTNNVEKPFVPAGLVTYEQEQQVKKTNRKYYDSADFQMLIHKSAKEGVWKRPVHKSLY